MKIQTNKIFALNEIGGRSNNEDSIYPSKENATKDDTLFLVCDGVGGAEKGEMASKLVCEGFGFYFMKKTDDRTLFNEDFVKGALEYSQGKIDAYLAENPDCKGMGTTLTLLHLNAQGATIAHVGDSRVYQIRAGKIIFKTQDHSFVNELVKGGIITQEKAKTHPKRNVITRAIQGNSVKSTKADVFVQTDVQAGDYFFLCSDGILEQITDEILIKILSAKTLDKEKINEINTRCNGHTKDNYSCYLIPIKAVEIDDDIPTGIISDEITDNIVEPKPSPAEKGIKSTFSDLGNAIGKSAKNLIKNFTKKK